MTEATRARYAVMFTDICGSTNLYEQRGDEFAFALVSRHDHLLRPLVAQQGGVVVKTIGDSIMARFADAGAAVDTAVAMQRALDAERRGGGFPISIRIGIHVGEMLETPGDLYGDGVNTAARVEALCGPNGIIVSRPVVDTIERSPYEVRSIGGVQLKGKSQPVEVFQLSWTGTFAEYADTVPRKACVFIARGETASLATAAVALSPGRFEYLKQTGTIEVEAVGPERLHFLPPDRVWRRRGKLKQHYLLYSKDVAERPTDKGLLAEVEAMLETAELLAADSILFLITGTTRGFGRRQFTTAVLRQYDDHLVRLAAYGRTSISIVGILVHGLDVDSTYELSQYRAPFTSAECFPKSASRMIVRRLASDQSARIARATGCDEILSGLDLEAGPVPADTPR